MSLETFDGVEELQKDEEVIKEDVDKKLKIHVPTKQVSTSSYGSRRSSLSGVGGEQTKAVVKDSDSASGKPDKPKFSTIKEKTKLKEKKKKSRLKSAKKKVAIKRQLKAISDDKVEDYDSSDDDQDISEIIILKPPDKKKLDDEPKVAQEKDEKDKILKTKMRKKGSKKKSKKRRLRRKFMTLDPAAEELERLLEEKDRLLKEELSKLDPNKAPSKPDSSFYPAPKNLEKRRCYFHKGAKALKCTVCSGGMYAFIEKLDVSPAK